MNKKRVSSFFSISIFVAQFFLMATHTSLATAQSFENRDDFDFLTGPYIENLSDSDDDSAVNYWPKPNRTRESIASDIPELSDTIINLGEKVWKIIEAGQPVANIHTLTANALPPNVSAWQDLESWQTPVSKVYQASYKSGFGNNVILFKYRILFTYGGSLNGKGRYLTNVTIIPAELNVSWGYRFSADVAVANITNTGTTADPIAAMELSISWKVDTLFRHLEYTSSYHLTGDGTFTDLTQGS